MIRRLSFTIFYVLILTVGALAQTEFTFCESIDDNFNAIKPFTSAKVKAPICFLVNLKEKTALTSLGWVIHRVGPDGRDQEFLEEWPMTIDPGCSTFCTNEPFVFHAPGKFRVYLIDWNKRQVGGHPGNFTEVFSKGEINIAP